MGVMYYNGAGVEQDYEKAAEWIEKAAEQGNVKAQKTLGDFYLYGVGVEQDEEKAIEWYNRAAEQGDLEAYFVVEELKKE